MHPLHTDRPSPSPRRPAPVPERSGNAIDAAATAFEQLCARRPPVVVDGAAAGCGLPARALPLQELRSLLLHPATGPAARNAALCALLTGDTPASEKPTNGRSGTGATGPRQGADRQLALLGLLLPGLRRATWRLQREFPHVDTDDLSSELVCGVLEALRGFDPTGDHVANRLLVRAVVRTRQFARSPAGSVDPRDVESLQSGEDRRVVPAGPFDSASAADLAGRGPAHPDFTLAAAVHAEGITVADAEIIARTRLDAVPFWVAAVQLGLPYSTARRRRARAERRLVLWLRERAHDDGDTPAKDAEAKLT
jgi:hypothetical protein